MRGKLFDDHSAVYHLLEDKLQRHLLKSHSSSSGVTSPDPTVSQFELSNGAFSSAAGSSFSGGIQHELTQPIVTQQRKSSITTGVGT